MKRIFWMMLISVLFLGVSTTMMVANAQEQTAPATDVQEQKKEQSKAGGLCDDEPDPCDWEPELVVGWEFSFDTDAVSGLSQKDREGIEEKWVREINQLSRDDRGKAKDCVVSCLVQREYYEEALEMAIRLDSARQKEAEALVIIQKDLLKADALLTAAQKRFDSADIAAAESQIATTLEKQTEILASMNLGACAKQADPWACFKKRVQWRLAFEWAVRVGNDARKREAAMNVCLKMVADRIYDGKDWQELKDADEYYSEYVTMNCVNTLDVCECSAKK